MENHTNVESIDNHALSATDADKAFVAANPALFTKASELTFCPREQPSLDMLSDEELDSLLARELRRVWKELAESQHELPRDARHVLYSRMRELYCR